ncbi:MAG: response regulator [Elusimicrobia bacterium]|nr:response regulator [Elusimicrobiota bacterium]
MDNKTDDRPKIVIVDDESDFLTTMERSLSPLYRVTALYGSEWTVKQVAAIDPDLILLDINMPEQGGFELCRDLRADPHFADTPIIFLTASSSGADYRRHLKAGGTRFLNKTIDRRRLLEALAEALSGAGSLK